MLVLGRKGDESVMLGDDIEVKVVSVRPDGRVRLGFVAPRDVPIYRREVWLKIKADQEGSATYDHA